MIIYIYTYISSRPNWPFFFPLAGCWLMMKMVKDGKKYLADPPVDYNLNMEKPKNSHHECVDHFPNRKRMSFRGITN